MIAMASDSQADPNRPGDDRSGDDGAVDDRAVDASAEVTCAFCRIVLGAEQAHIVFSDEVAVAFLDRVPLFPGHTLIVPTGHVDTLANLPKASVGPFFLRVQRMAAVVEETMGAKGTFVAMNNRVSQSVPHLHSHVVPRRPKDGLRGFFWPRTRYDSEDQAAAVAQRLADAWAQAQRRSGLPGLDPSGE